MVISDLWKKFQNRNNRFSVDVISVLVFFLSYFVDDGLMILKILGFILFLYVTFRISELNCFNHYSKQNENSIKFFMVIAAAFIIFGFVYFAHWKQNQRFKALEPFMSIRMFPSQDTFCFPPPLLAYELTIQNQNPNSVEIKDFRIEFIFENVIDDIENIPLWSTGANVEVRGCRFCKINPDGTIYRSQERQILPSLIQKCAFEIQKYEVSDNFYNTNVVNFICEDWPKDVAHSATIIVDTSKVPESKIKLNNEGTFHGKFYYTIYGKEYSELINGVIPNIKDEGVTDNCFADLSKFNPKEGTIYFSTNDPLWLEKNNHHITFIPHIKEEDFEIWAYRDTDNVLKVLISNAYKKDVYLYFEDLDLIKTDLLNHKHIIIITWNKDSNSLYIDGILVDSYPIHEE